MTGRAQAGGVDLAGAPRAELTVEVDLELRPCRRDDLKPMEWLGLYRKHRRLIRAAFRGQERGEGLMLVADAQGFPVAQVWIDFARPPEDAALLWALRAFQPFRGSGVGSRLLDLAEDEVRRRGLPFAEIGAERDNAEAERLYRRRGYRPHRLFTEEVSFEHPDGYPVRWMVEQTILRKRLDRPGV